MDATKTASYRVAQNTAEATGNLIGKKIANKITSVGQPKNKGREEDNEINETLEIYIHQKSVNKSLTM